MKRFLFSLTLAILALGTAQAQEAASPQPGDTEASGPSLPKFSLPFKIPGLSGGDEEPEPVEGDLSPETPGAQPVSQPGASPSMPNPPVPGSDALPPGVAPDSNGKLDSVQRSNFIISKIRNNFRQLDPFGLPMDPTNPTESPALSAQYEEIDDVPVLTNSSLKNALATLPISGIYPKKRIIVIGARSFSQGDQFGMKIDELTIRLRFEGLRDHKIYFKDLDTQEVASVDFNPKPKEFEPITSNTSAPQGEGIVPMDSLFIVN